MMTEQEMRKGFAYGGVLVQEEWSTAAEIEAVDKLLQEGVCILKYDWEYKDNFQCKRRLVVGVPK